MEAYAPKYAPSRPPLGCAFSGFATSTGHEHNADCVPVCGRLGDRRVRYRARPRHALICAGVA